jgi:hypothetical protein
VAVTGPDQPGLFEGATSSKRRGRPPGSKNRKTTARAAPGRVERALAAELRGSDLSGAAKAHLRAAAGFIDTAETAADVAAGTKAALAYLQLRQSYGLAGAPPAGDSLAAFLAGLAVPTPGLRDPPDA